MRVERDGVAQRNVVDVSRRTYERMAGVYDLLDAVYEVSWKRKLRRDVFAGARGRLLDVGVGTGCNIPFYPQSSPAIGIDTSPAMLRRAAQRARRHDRAVDLLERDLVDTHFPDAAFDTIAATYVMCCLPLELQGPALRELRRICAPDGRIMLLDYTPSSQPGIRLGMRVMSPWLKWAFAARYDAGTEEAVPSAALRVVERRFYMADTVRLLVLQPE